MKKLLLFLALIAFSSPAIAVHIMGGSIHYKCIGADKYEISLFLYRDCASINFPNQFSVLLESNGCPDISMTLSLVPGSVQDITPVCPQFPATDCPGSPAGTVMVPTSVEKYIYIDTITFSSTCDLWDISFTTCCRYDNTTLEFNTSLDKSVTPCNNSPVFTTEPTIFACANQLFNYSLGAYDPDGDSLAFSIQLCSGQTVNFLTTGPIEIDPETGNITFTPNGAQLGVLCIKVEEFRNNIRIGQIIRDMPIVVTQCNNPAPTVSPIPGINDYKTAVCPGQNIDFDITVFDPNQFQAISIDANLNGQPAPITVTGTATNKTVNFNYTPPSIFRGDLRLTLDVKDDGCPVPAVISKTYLIKVMDPYVDLGPDITICQGETTTLRAKSLFDFLSYQWIPSSPIGMCQDTCNVSPIVTTTYTVNASNGSCSASDTITVFVNIIIEPNIIQSSDTLTASISGTAYQWYLDGNVIPGATNQNIIITQSGDYTVEVTDNNGCTVISDIFTAYKTGIQDILINGKVIKMYPNPVDDIVIIDLTELQTVADLHIYDNSGKLIEPRTGMSGLTEIDMSKYPDGVYYFKLKSEHEQVTKMIIKN